MQHWGFQFRLQSQKLMTAEASVCSLSTQIDRPLLVLLIAVLLALISTRRVLKLPAIALDR